MTTTTTITQCDFSERDINKDFETVLELVTTTTGITREQLVGKTRPDPVAHARMLTYWLMREMEHSLSSIGNLLNRDHGSVLNGCRRISGWAEVDERFKLKLERMRQHVEKGQVSEIKPQWKCPECGYTEGEA